MYFPKVEQFQDFSNLFSLVSFELQAFNSKVANKAPLISPPISDQQHLCGRRVAVAAFQWTDSIAKTRRRYKAKVVLLTNRACTGLDVRPNYRTSRPAHARLVSSTTLAL